MTSSALIDPSNFGVTVTIPVTHKLSMSNGSRDVTVVTECRIAGQTISHAAVMSYPVAVHSRYDPVPELIRANLRAIKHTLEK